MEVPRFPATDHARTHLNLVQDSLAIVHFTFAGGSRLHRLHGLHSQPLWILRRDARGRSGTRPHARRRPLL